VKVRHESTTVTCGPICDRPCGRYAGSHAGMTVCPTCERIAVGVDYRDEESKESDSEHKSQDEILASHASEGSIMGCKVLLARTA
jgi:uncharacterized Zn finger protein (UPF0148 family)